MSCSTTERMEHPDRDSAAEDALEINNYHETLASRLDGDVLGEIFFHMIPPSYLIDPSLVGNPNSAWCQALRTKKALTLVCKGWYNAAIPLLYRDILFRRVGQVSALARTLFQFDASGRLCSYIGTLRVSCYVPDIYTSVFLSDLSQILARCPSIAEIYINAFSNSDPSSPHQDDPRLWMIQNLPTTIEHLAFGSPVWFPHVIPQLVDCSHRLTSLTFSGLEEGITDHPEVKLDFPNLTNLRYIFPWSQKGNKNRILPSYFAENWSLPKLNTLSICISRFAEYEMEDWKKFFECNGRKLQRLMIFSKFRGSHSALTYLLSCCARLQHLVLPYDPALRISSKTVKYLDLCRYPLNLSDLGFTLARTAPHDIDSEALPKLCCVRDIYESHAYIPFAIPPTADYKIDFDYPGIHLIGYEGAVFRISSTSSYTFPPEYTDSENEMDIDEESDGHLPLDEEDTGSEHNPWSDDDENGMDVCDSSGSDDDSEYWSDNADYKHVQEELGHDTAVNLFEATLGI